MLQTFYHSVVASLIFYAVVCWGSRVKAADANRLSKLIRRAGSVLGVKLESLVEVMASWTTTPIPCMPPWRPTTAPSAVD